jgi:hypothetical protein
LSAGEKIGNELEGASLNLSNGKFEPKRGWIEEFLALRPHGVYIEVGGCIEPGIAARGFLASGLLLAVVLYLEKSGDVLFALAAQTVFLEVEIVELALVDQQRLGINEVGADGLVFVCKKLGEFEAAESIDARFERRDAEETPLGVGERLNEGLLLIANGFVLLHESGYVLFVKSGVFGGQQDGAAG